MKDYGPWWWLSWLPLVAFAGFALWRYIRTKRRRPRFKKEEIIYQEFFASGASQKNLLTKFGGARNCLRLVVARDFLWITSWFPFSLFAALYDLEHVVPLQRIVSLKPARLYGLESLVLVFTDERGGTHVVRLQPKRRAQFVQAIGVHG